MNEDEICSENKTVLTPETFYETVIRQDDLQFQEFQYDDKFAKTVKTSLEKAIRDCDSQFVSQVLSLSSERGCLNELLVPVFHYASTSCHSVEIFRMLMNAIEDIDCLDDDGETPLFNATKCANYMTAFELLLAGSQVNACNSHRRTPLHVGAASIFMPLDIVQALVENGASVDALDCYGYSPLVLHLNNHFAFSREVKNPQGKDSIAIYLIQHGTYLNSESTHSAFHWYFNIKHDLYLLKLAEAAGMNLQSPFASWIHTKFESLKRNSPSKENSACFISDAVDFYEKVFKSPQGLSGLCRKEIRNLVSAGSCGVRFWWRIQEISLPKPIISYLLLEDVIPCG